jgi:hypothetical protein
MTNRIVQYRGFQLCATSKRERLTAEARVDRYWTERIENEPTWDGKLRVLSEIVSKDQGK